MSESWLNSRVGNNQIRIPNYKVYRWDRKVKKRGGGICVYVHKNLLVNTCIYDEYNVSNEHIELFALQVGQKCTKPIMLISVYRPPQGKQNIFLEQLTHTLTAAMNCSKTIIVGDFNLDYKMMTCKAIKTLKHLEREFNLKQLITDFTRITTSTESILDHIYTNITDITEAGIIPLSISDHFMTYIIVKKLRYPTEPQHLSADK